MKPSASVRFVPQGWIILTSVNITTQTYSRAPNARGNPIKHVMWQCASGVLQLHMRGTDTYAVMRFKHVVIETPYFI
jgi:hypothetical protein